MRTRRRPGRPRLSDDSLQARIADYCARYRVTPKPDGLPPFPAGKRETLQHREWLLVYKAQRRLDRRMRGQCERCEQPAEAGSIFCAAHRGDDARRGGKLLQRPPATSAAELDALMEAQQGRCFVCHGRLEARRGVVHRSATAARPAALLHPRCHEAVALAEAFGPAELDRVRSYLWPEDERA